MANKMLSQMVHTIPLLDPVANAFAGTVTPSPISAKDAHAVTFFYYKGVGTTGTATLTVEACSDTVPTLTTAIAFRYRLRTATDVWGALTNATTAGFTTTAGSSQMYIIEVDADAIANSGYSYVRLKSVEVVASAVVGAIWAELQMRVQRAIQLTQLT